jgi:hypothetical protein
VAIRTAAGIREEVFCVFMICLIGFVVVVNRFNCAEVYRSQQCGGNRD